MTARSAPRPIIIDCDPGHDDAVALLMALSAPETLDVLGITTVAGNTDVVQAERNARRIRDLAGRPDVPVRAGCARPLVLPLRDAGAFHGATGLDGLPGPGPAGAADPEHAVDFLVSRLRSAPAPVTLACLAPLTNVALALIKAPDVAEKIDEIVFMGGARSAGGNVTPCATFNLHCDPHAAHVVFESGCRLTVVSLDATASVIVTDAVLAEIGQDEGPVAQAVRDMYAYFNARRIAIYGYGRGQTTLNDPCVIAYLLDRSLLSGGAAAVSIEHRSDLTLGMSVVDVLGRSGRPPNALWLDRADDARILQTLVRTVAGRVRTA